MPSMDDASPMNTLLDTLPQVGRVEWIGVRPERGGAMVVVQEARVSPERGLDGDRYDGRPGSKRQVTLIQHEHLAVITGCLGWQAKSAADLAEWTRDLPGGFSGDLPGDLPGVLRRNVVVSGVNLLALKGKTFRVGDAVLRWTGLCHPCSKMETALGPGGYNAVRGHGGITASVERAGCFAVGDAVQRVAQEKSGPA